MSCAHQRPASSAATASADSFTNAASPRETEFAHPTRSDGERGGPRGYPLCFEEDPVVVYDGPSKHAAYLAALNQLAGRLLEATEYQEHLEELLERSGHTHRLAEET